MTLEELHIRDVGVIDEVTLTLGPGLTVVTGETGAGKTMIVTALQLLLGGRADAMRIRDGARRAVVEARLAPPPAAAARWTDHDDEDVVCVREVVRAEGAVRSRARIGGRLASVTELGEALGDVIEIHGQGEGFRLAEPGVQRALLDRAGGDAVADAAQVYRGAWRAWSDATEELAALEHGERERRRELGQLDRELAEIDEVAPLPGEEDALATSLRRAEHAEALVAAAHQATAALVGDGAARDGVGVAVAALRGVAGVDDVLDGLLQRTERVADEVQDVGLELTGYAETVDLDPAALEDMRRRAAALRGLLRSYGADTTEVLAYAAAARERRVLLAGGEERRDLLERQVAELRDAVERSGDRLRAARRDAGARLGDVVGGHLRDLAMPGASLVVDVAPAAAGPDGADRVTFLLAAHPGQTPLPLARTASGGERSRVALALRLALTAARGTAGGADRDGARVMVFDEVDAGVGGAVALAVGERLARLARGRQVLCVTHQAQIAVFADHHVVVARDPGAHGPDTAGQRPASATARVRTLGDHEVHDELARLLSGRHDSPAAVEAAVDLREEARRRLRRSSVGTTPT